MNRGRSDSNAQHRKRRLTGAAAFHGNSTVVARACDDFFRRRGIESAGMAGLMKQEVQAAKGLGRAQRETRAERIAAEFERGWWA